MKSRWSIRARAGAAQPKNDRLRKLARSLDALASQDQTAIRRARELVSLRQQAARELHGICESFVQQLNGLLVETTVGLDPEQYPPDGFQDGGVNLFQINARGRILQLEFESTVQATSTENFRVPYILEGGVRSFNQQLLEKQVIEEQALFYTIERTRNLWRFFDARTYRSGVVNTDYLTSLMEQLL
ncbi:MAG TPA: hypothetical protein VMI94_17410 [Bryobacteraceae bacterium]|nr:hypothetical protein [Bryobacteraceae bacterium]